MENFSKLILEKLEPMEDPQYQIGIEDFVRLFFNRKTKGNKALMLGVDDTTLIKDFMGVSGEEIIKNAADYLIHLKKVVRKDQEKITFKFRNRNAKPSFEEQQIIKALFEGCNERQNLEDAFNKGEILPLTIRKPVAELLSDLPNAISKLAGEGWFKSITISSSFESNIGLHSSIDELYIITQSYFPLIQDVKAIADEESKTGKCGFWKTFGDEETNPDGFNFVILNNINDHLQRIFVDLYGLYKERYKIDESNSKILRRVFFVNDKKYTSETRSSENYSAELVNEIQSLRNDINELQTEQRDAELYLYLLERLSKNNRLKELDALSAFVAESRSICDSIGPARANVFDDIGNVLKQFPHDFQQTDNAVGSLKSVVSDKTDRLKKCESFEKVFLSLIDFAEKYLTKEAQKEIVESKDSFANSKSPYLEKKLFGYSKSNKEFEGSLEAFADRILSWWKRSLQNGLRLPFGENVEEERIREKLKFEGIGNFSERFAVPELLACQFGQSMMELENSSLNLFSGFSALFGQNLHLNKLTDGSYLSEMEKILQKANEKLVFDVSFYDKKFTPYKDDYESHEVVKRLLVEKLKEILEK